MVEGGKSRRWAGRRIAREVGENKGGERDEGDEGFKEVGMSDCYTGLRYCSALFDSTCLR